MGHVYASILLHSADKRRSHRQSLLVDTGSTYTWIARGILADLGIRPMKEILIETIEGKVIKREIGEAAIEYDGECATRIVVFAKKKDGQVIGADTLEGLRLEVDPVGRRLKKVKAVLAV